MVEKTGSDSETSRRPATGAEVREVAVRGRGFCPQAEAERVHREHGEFSPLEQMVKWGLMTAREFATDRGIALNEAGLKQVDIVIKLLPYFAAPVQVENDRTAHTIEILNALGSKERPDLDKRSVDAGTIFDVGQGDPDVGG